MQGACQAAFVYITPGLIQSVVNNSVGLQPVEIIAFPVLIYTAEGYRKNIPVAYTYIKIANGFSMTCSANELYVHIGFKAVNEQFACGCCIFGYNKKDTAQI